MPVIDFSSEVWETARTSAAEFCTDQNSSSMHGLADPASGATIQMERGLMKVVRADLGQGLVNVLGFSPVACDVLTNTPIPVAIGWIVLPSAQGFVKFKIANNKPVTVRVFFYAGTDRSTRLVGESPQTFTAAGQIHEVRRSNPCELFRLVVIEVPQAGLNVLLQNVQFEIAQPVLGIVLPVPRLYCLIQRLLVAVGLIRERPDRVPDRPDRGHLPRP